MIDINNSPIIQKIANLYQAEPGHLRAVCRPKQQEAE